MTLLRTSSLAVLLSTATAASAGEIRLTTSDGATVLADHVGDGEKGVLLVHDVGRSRADWTSFATRLGGNGFSVLTLGLREPPGDDWTSMVADVQAGIAWLDGRGTVAVVGAEGGANLALAAAAAGEGVDNLVLLSPSLNAGGVKVSGPIAAYSGPLLIVADAGSSTGARTATLMGDKATGKSRVELVDAGSHGHRMLNTVAELEAVLVGWLNGAGTTGKGAELARPDRTLEAGAPDAIPTTGKNYGEPQ